MPANPTTPVINTPEHHLGAMSLVILTRAPNDANLRAAARLVDSAATAAWALRPDDLSTLGRQQYRQLLDYAAAPQVLDLALYLGGDTKQIRTLMDHIAREIAELLIHYTPPKAQD
ncbi:hypothetical protein [Streptomyces scabiei]|uniref:hypothetical protein n=1 Tax=Streptomyces scabiei TaxID=1930 RepID=UPI002FEF7E34